MARKVYFAFHYQNDIWRVNQVRNSDITKKDREAAGFYDSGLWERAKKTSTEAIKKMILAGLSGTSVTAILLGQETAKRPWVKYELEQSWKRGNGLIGIYIHQLKDVLRMKGIKGENILQNYSYTHSGTKYSLTKWFKTYDWVADSGYLNFGNWVEESAEIAESLKKKDIM